MPTETVLGIGTFESTAGGLATFDTSLKVTVGEVSALEPICLFTQCSDWLQNSPNTYGGGQDFFVNVDAGFPTFTPDSPTAVDDFQTFVDPGAAGIREPITLLLFGAGVAGAAAMRRREAKRS